MSASSRRCCCAAATGRSRRTSGARSRCSAMCGRRRWLPRSTSTRSMRCRSAIMPREWTARCCAISDCPPRANPTCPAGRTSSTRSAQPEGEVRIAVVGKYTNLLDSYKSLGEALAHGGIANRVKVRLDWVDSEIFEQDGAVHRLEEVHGILVPGGFGERGTPGKIEAVRFARERAPAIPRHLLRHADGGDRGGPQPWRPARVPPPRNSVRARRRWSDC